MKHFHCILTLALAFSFGCGEQAITETGFYDPLPGDFDYFMQRYQPCETEDSYGVCLHSYDSKGRLVSLTCATTGMVVISYDDEELIRTIDETVLSDGEWQHRIVAEDYELDGGFVSSIEVIEESDGELEVYARTYIRDELDRVETIEWTGDRVGVQEFSYDDETGLLALIEYNIDQGIGNVAGDTSIEWDDAERIKKLALNLLWDDVSTASQIVGFSYDDSGRLLFVSHDDDADGTVDNATDYRYDCE